MDKKQMQQLIVMLPIILVAGIFGYFKYLLAPLNQKKAQLKEELKTIQKEYREAEGRVARLPKLEKEIAVLNLEIAENEKKLPPNKDVPSLIRLLSKKMSAHNIQWEQLAPATQSPKDYYIEHSYTIPFTATYHSLAQFLAEIGQMERIFASRFTKLSGSPSETHPGAVKGTLTFLIYTSKG